MDTKTQAETDRRCPMCGVGRLHPQVVTEHFPYEDDGTEVMVVAENVPVERCDNPACAEEFSGPEAARIRHEAICRALGLLTPGEIRALRERLGLTQEQFTKLTRIGEATICRWERGRLLQNPAMDRYLRLIAASENNVRLLQGRNSDEAPDAANGIHREAERPGTDLGVGRRRQRTRTRERKFVELTSRALQRVRAGSRPDEAWLEVLGGVYAADQLPSQVKHSCPKWAFCILCHKGRVKKVSPGCCPESERSSSAEYTLKALRELLDDERLATNKRELKRRVFGEKGKPGYRTPNDEVEVLLALWEAGEIE